MSVRTLFWAHSGRTLEISLFAAKYQSVKNVDTAVTYSVRTIDIALVDTDHTRL